MAKIKLLMFILFFSISFSQNLNMPTGEDYITGEDGIKRMYVNIWGHVKKPGPYLVYKDIDLITLLSIAGGPLDGANLSKVKLISQVDNKVTFFNFNQITKSSLYNEIDFKPYDTIVIEPTLKYYILNNASAINMVLQLINLGITISD
tara:strand:+ start:152 stop:595 length:444 start_codon:yes stop_codon:yes gene_type:complete